MSPTSNETIRPFSTPTSLMIVRNGFATEFASSPESIFSGNASGASTSASLDAMLASSRCEGPERPKICEQPPSAKPTRVPEGYTFWVLGAERAVLRDAYHSFLRLRWSVSLLLIGLGLLAINLVFAVAYTIVGGVEGGASSFFDMYSFSIQTM